MNQHAPYPDRLVGIAAKLVMDGLEKGWTFSVFEREGRAVVETTAKEGSVMSGSYRYSIAALADEVAYLVKACPLSEGG